MRCDTAASMKATSVCDRNMYGRDCAGAAFGDAPCCACSDLLCADAAPAGIAAPSAAADLRNSRRPLDSLMASPFFGSHHTIRPRRAQRRRRSGEIREHLVRKTAFLALGADCGDGEEI